MDNFEVEQLKVTVNFWRSMTFIFMGALIFFLVTESF